MAVGSWASGAFNALTYTVYTMRFPFYGPRETHHLCCKLPGVLRLSCEDTLACDTGVPVGSSILLLIPFCPPGLTLILVTILQMASAEGCMKAFPTCSSHLTVGSLCYSGIVFMYMRPISFHMPGQDKVSVFCTVLTPTLNPLIDSLQNKD
ncbi:Olfactory Receptor 2Aj1, partial [Manis pentadactyla]